MTILENLQSTRKVEFGSNRNFGFIFSAVFAAVAFWPFLRSGQTVHWWALGMSAIFLGCALFADHLLAPLNKLWGRFGLILHSVISPLIMALLFYCAVTPVALIIKLTGKDIVRLRRNSDHSYWIERNPPGPSKKSMGHQF